MQVDAATKVQLIEGLVAAGLKQVEVTSFVSPKWVPQLADAAEVYRKIAKQVDVKYPVLVPNMKVSPCKQQPLLASCSRRADTHNYDAGLSSCNGCRSN